MDSVKTALYTTFTETMSQNELPKKVQDHLICSLENLQLALFHSNKQDLRSAAVMDAPEVCRELLSECFWLFSLMALNKTPLQPQWDRLSATNRWDCFPDELTTHFAREDPNKPSDVDRLNTVFTQLEKDFVALFKEQLKRFHRLLTSDRSSENSREENPEREGESSREAVFTITLDFLRREDKDLAERLRRLHTIDFKASVFGKKLKIQLKQKFSQVCEGGATAGNPALLKEIYRELDITEIYQEHGVREPADTALAFENIFKKRSKSGEPIRTVLTEGVAGVGKTVLTQKITVDWAEGRVYQDVQLLFPFTFRELNKLKDRSFSLEGLLHYFFNGTEELCSFKDLQLLFIFDGLDECRLPLDFTNTKVLTEPTESARVEELLVNLIRGNLLPSARLWITTRPKAANQIPAESVSMVTEVRVFSDPQREQFFKKRFRDEQKATAVISHIKNNPSLRIMSRSPDFCWIIYNFIIKKQELPTTLTGLYIHLLQENFLRNSTSEKDTNWSSETKKILQAVGKLAFEEVQKGNLAFYASDLSRFGLDDSQVACFTRTNMKELLAALHVHQTFFSSGENLLSPHYITEAAFYHSAVDWFLQSPSGHLDMFLGFLLGLSLSTNQKLLKGLVSDTGSDIQETVNHIHMKLNVGLSAERSLNLLHCLNELNDRSLLEDMQKLMREGPANKQMSAAQWS
uniref:NACHT domain-containing protein n=1 Tax=Neogobius melanostomus TaxID=47308 RepID=A0A8C6UKV0_9GOBI